MRFNKRKMILSVVVGLGVLTVLNSSMQTATAQKKEDVAYRARYAPMSIGVGLVTTPQIIKGLIYRQRPATISGGMGRAFGYERYHEAKNSKVPQSMGQVFGNEPIYNSQHVRYSRNAPFVPTQAYYDQRGTLIP